MKHFSAFLSRLHPMHMLLSALLFITLAFTIATPAMAAHNATNPGVVQLDEITQKTAAAVDGSSMTKNPSDQLEKGGLNEIQGTADHNKMVTADDSDPSMLEQIKNVLTK